MRSPFAGAQPARAYVGTPAPSPTAQTPWPDGSGSLPDRTSGNGSRRAAPRSLQPARGVHQGSPAPGLKMKYVRDGRCGRPDAPSQLRMARSPVWAWKTPVAHFDTLDGRTVVQPSNPVFMYSPRFSSVRQVVSLVANDQVNGSSGMHTAHQARRCTTKSSRQTSTPRTCRLAGRLAPWCLTSTARAKAPTGSPLVWAHKPSRTSSNPTRTSSPFAPGISWKLRLATLAKECRRGHHLPTGLGRPGDPRQREPPWVR